MFSVLDDMTFSQTLWSVKSAALKCYPAQRLVVVKVNVNLPVLYHSNLRDGSGSNPSR